MFRALCEAKRSLKVLLVNAQHVKNVPSRKSDALDAVWLAKCQQVNDVGKPCAREAHVPT